MVKWTVVAAVIGATVAALPAGAEANEGAEAASASAETAEDDHPALREAIDEVLADDELRRTDVGIFVEDLETGEVLYSRNADRAMNPASNVKLLTAVVALEKLGPNHNFETTLSTNSEQGAEIDDLYVRGEGEAFLLYEHVLGWASQLRRAGVESVDGDLIVDDGAFARAYLPPGFDQKDAGAAYRSPIGAVSVNFNAVTVEIAPTAPGQSPSLSVDPPNDYVEIDNRARTVPGPYPNLEVRSESDDDNTTLTVEGTIGTRADAVQRRKRIGNPPAFSGAVVAEAMEAVGIEFGGEIRRGTTPEEATTLVDHQSRPVLESVLAMNKWSNNFIAEQLLRVVGGLDDNPSTWDDARRVAREVLAEFGLEPGEYQLNNGSGLYEGNELSARQIVTLLREMRSHPYGPEFASSLAIAGVDGTLSHRLDDESTKANLRAKTGTLNEVSALSGYVHTASGRPVAFSILFNDTPRRAWRYRDDQDDIARSIAEFDE